jgi:hypothetical protein
MIKKVGLSVAILALLGSSSVQAKHHRHHRHHHHHNGDRTLLAMSRDDENDVDKYMEQSIKEAE